MRCLALMTDAFGGDGGIARFSRDLLGAIAAMPEVERVDVLCRHAPRRDEPLPEKVTQVAVAGGRLGYALRALARGATGRYDVVLCGHLHLAPVASVVARMRGIPLWVQLYGIEAWQRPGPLRAWAIRDAALITAISRYTRARFLEWANVALDRARILPCTVDGGYAPGPKPTALAERIGVRGRRVMLTVSRIDRGDCYKGHDKVLRALKALAGSRPDLDYVIAGDGDDRGRLEELARELGVAHRVHFVGQVSDSELIDYYRLADVFIMPSAKEGFGIVFLEAQACGLPVIGGAGDGTRDPLADGQLGALVDPDRDSELREAIETALDTPRGVAATARFDGTHFRQHVRGLAALLAAPDA